MEQGGTRGSEKWGDNNNNIVAGGAVGGRQEPRQGAPHAQDRCHPTRGKRNISPLVGGAEVCATCKDTGHLHAYCPRAICGRCGNHGHLIFVCNTVLPWEFVAPMCGFQARGKGFFYIHDHSTPNHTTDRNRFIVISVVEGQASGWQLEEFFNAYINTN
uniref:CCHC-type domain-containing protein n=1 Tax=Hordeum vulgare subsp. vulgare TaxID=112509 RepID=A0A8I6Y0L5_HORVV